LSLSGSSDTLFSGIVTRDGNGYLVAVSRPEKDSSQIYVWHAAQNDTWQSVEIDSAHPFALGSPSIISQLALVEDGSGFRMYSVEEKGSNGLLVERRFDPANGKLQNLNVQSFPERIGPLMLDADTVVVGVPGGVATYSSDLTKQLSYASV